MTYRRRYLRRHRRLTGRDLAAPAIAGLLLAALMNSAGHAAPAAVAPADAQAPPGSVAAQVIAFAQAREAESCPYVWGGTGPCQDGYDCSGLAQQAYASAGITIPRTSQEQWAAGPQVATPAPGDLVFFAGADGTWSAPGHVGIVVDPATHTMIDAYETGTNVEYDTYGLPGSQGGLTDPVGFTDPAEG